MTTPSEKAQDCYENPKVYPLIRDVDGAPIEGYPYIRTVLCCMYIERNTDERFNME